MPKAKGPFVSVIIPAYNEAGRLPLTLVDVDRHLKEQNYTYEIIVVNDGSTDETAEIVKRFKPLISRFKFINNPTNMGRGAAVRIGMLATKGQWRVVMDADNCVTIVEFTKMMPYLKKETFDIVVGSRMVKGASVRPRLPLMRFLSDMKINIFARLLLRIQTRDSLSRFVCFRGEVADTLFPITKLDRWSGSIEAIAVAERLKLNTKEMPIFSSPKTGSHFKTMDYLQIFVEIIKMRWWLSRGKYRLE